jgi:hypothetical protein
MKSCCCGSTESSEDQTNQRLAKLEDKTEPSTFIPLKPEFSMSLSYNSRRAKPDGPSWLASSCWKPLIASGKRLQSIGNYASCCYCNSLFPEGRCLLHGSSWLRELESISGIMEANKVVKNGKRSFLSCHCLALSVPCSLTPICNLWATNVLHGQITLCSELVKIHKKHKPESNSYKKKNR